PADRGRWSREAGGTDARAIPPPPARAPGQAGAHDGGAAAPACQQPPVRTMMTDAPDAIEQDDLFPTSMALDDDKPHEECGVFGVWRSADAAALTALGLHALQHRGQEAAGIVSLDDSGLFHSHKGL